jgi:hypothetical protein
VTGSVEAVQSTVHMADEAEYCHNEQCVNSECRHWAVGYREGAQDMLSKIRTCIGEDLDRLARWGGLS